MKKQVMTLTELREYLRGRCDASNQKAVAQALGVSDSFLSDVMRGNRKPGKKMLAGLNMRELESSYEIIR